MSRKDFWSQVLLAYDASECSEAALTLLTDELPKIQTLTIFNVHNPRRNFVPTPFRFEFMKKNLETRFLGKNQVKIEGRERGDRETNDLILEKFVAGKCTLLMLGFVGSKGWKPRECDLSSRLRQFLYESKASLAVVLPILAQIRRPPPGTHHALYCLDGSDLSLQGLLTAISFCLHFALELTILHATTPDLTAQAKHLRVLLKTIDFKTLPHKLQFIESDLLSYLKQHCNKFDWILLTRNGLRGEISRRRFVGTVCTNIVSSVNCNTIILSH